MHDEIAVKKVRIEASVDTAKAIEQANELEKLLKSANSLANELADTISGLKLNIKA